MKILEPSKIYQRRPSQYQKKRIDAEQHNLAYAEKLKEVSPVTVDSSSTIVLPKADPGEVIEVTYTESSDTEQQADPGKFDIILVNGAEHGRMWAQKVIKEMKEGNIVDGFGIKLAEPKAKHLPYIPKCHGKRY